MTEEKKVSSVFFGGLPTDIDVAKIEESIGVPEIDVLIPYSSIEAATGIARSSNRFKTVLEAWRRKLRNEKNIVTECVPGDGVKAATNSRRLELVDIGIKQSSRKVVRVIKIAESTPSDGLKAHEQKLREWQLKYGSDHIRMVQSSRKALVDEQKLLED